MSQIDDIILLCEGDDQSVDVRLLETARLAVVQSVPIARRVTIRPAGSKVDLPASMRAHRAIRGSKLVFAVRDRDFLREDQVRAQRIAALSLDAKETVLKAYPLHRHCVESYLLDPPFLTVALGLGEKPTPEGIDPWKMVNELAEARRWIDICRGTLEALNHELRDNRASCETGPTNRQEALAEAQAALAKYQSEAGTLLSGFDVTRELDALDGDLTADGPLWARVDGKKMLGKLDQILCKLLRKGGLKERLLKHAETHAAPTPLIEEMRALLQRIDDVVGSQAASRPERFAPR